MTGWGKRWLISSMKTRSIRTRFPQPLENAIAFPTLPPAPTTVLTNKRGFNGNPILLKPLHQEVINGGGEGIKELRLALGESQKRIGQMSRELEMLKKMPWAERDMTRHLTRHPFRSPGPSRPMV